MKRLWIMSVLVLGVGIGCVAATVAQNFVVPPVRAGTNPTRWEAMCVHRDVAKVGNSDIEEAQDPDGWNPALMKYGAEGWEPFAAVKRFGGNEHMLGFCFKRPLP